MEIKAFVSGMVETNSYVVSNDEGDCVIIDCESPCDELCEYIDSKGLKPLFLLLTHGHFDHTGGAQKVREKYGLKIAAGVNEKPVFEGGRKSGAKFSKDSSVIEPDIYLNDGDTISSGSLSFYIMNTPGHTAGSLCYVIEDVIFSGDTLFLEDCGRCDLFSGSFEDMLKSLRRLKDMEGDYTVYPGHGPKTTLGHERCHNTYMNSEE